ncbi:MAG: glycoside hydrolase family 43 protein [Prevotella sp.]|nr:glycoside hydrolase family 43 protein [Prevotella sp.]
MKCTMMTALLAAVITTSLQAQKATFSYFRYTGHDARFNKTIDKTKEFLNPILAGFYPDPAVCRKGDTYYLVNSSFSFFPGVPIFESKDMVNWQQIGHVLDHESQLQLEGQWVSGGIYAPAISYNEKNQTFYMITTNVGKGGNFYVKTSDPHQGWSDPIYLPEVDGIDPSFLFDSDGKAYIVHNAPVMGKADYEGQRAIRLLEFDGAGDCTVGEPLEIVRGGTHVTERPVWIEGPHLYHIGKYYYLMCAEGGTGDGHSEVIFRAKKPQGPWEECPQNPILTQRDLTDQRADKVTSTGHADLIQTKEGDWWAVFLGCRPYEGGLYNTGRETFLLPVTWKDGWPQILESGKAVPTVVAKRNLSPSPLSPLTSNFTFTDRFEGQALNHRWLFLRNPPANACELTDKGLALRATGSVRQTKPQSTVYYRQQHTAFDAETCLMFNATSSKRIAGLVLFQDETHHFLFGKTLLDKRPALVLKRMEKEEILIGSCFLPADDQPVRLKIEADGRYYGFYYAVGNADTWQPIAVGVDGANLSTERAGGFIGAMIGLTATNVR